MAASSCAELLVENKKMRLKERNKNKNILEFSDRNKLFITTIPFLISKRMRPPKNRLCKTESRLRREEAYSTSHITSLRTAPYKSYLQKTVTALVQSNKDQL
jgi:hypothetical protein